MRLILRLMLGWLFPVVILGATPLESARRAQVMLGAETWSRIIRVENRSARSSYPTMVDALVFEQAGILWFYAATEGTQSLSLYRDRLAEDKDALGPLLRAINPGFVSFGFLPDSDEGVAQYPEVPLPNGCFIECLAAWRARVVRGERMEQPRLLSCYADSAAGLRGHTVLTYETPQGFVLLDPADNSRPQLVPGKWKEDPLALASIVMEGATVLKARWVPVDKHSVPLVAKAGVSRRWDEKGAPHVMQ